MKRLSLILVALAVLAGVVTEDADARSRVRQRQTRASSEAKFYQTVCGNSNVEAPEVCDDGNTSANDGCAADCSAVETDWSCTGDPSVCVVANNFAWTFDGTNEHFTINDSASISGGAAKTVCMSIREPTVSIGTNIAGKYNTNQSEWAIQKHPTESSRFRVFFNNGLTSSGDSCDGNANNAGVANNTTYQLCVVFDGSLATNELRLKHYVNGALKTWACTGTIPAALSNGTAQLQIAKVQILGTGLFPGTIDEYVEWPIALTSGQVTTYYNSGSFYDPRNISGTLNAWFRMGDSSPGAAGTDSTTTVFDRSGNNNHATPQNAEAGDRVTPGLVP